jgi:hypothetical protein
MGGRDPRGAQAIGTRLTTELQEWRETRRLLEKRLTPVTLEEDEILIACALRFDGYKYREMAGFDEEEPLQRVFEAG